MKIKVHFFKNFIWNAEEDIIIIPYSFHFCTCKKIWLLFYGKKFLLYHDSLHPLLVWDLKINNSSTSKFYLKLHIYLWWCDRCSPNMCSALFPLLKWQYSIFKCEVTSRLLFFILVCSSFRYDSSTLDFNLVGVLDILSARITNNLRPFSWCPRYQYQSYM